MSTGSDNSDSLDVPANLFKKYLEATAVKYIQMGRANHVQDTEECNFEETIRHTEQKFSMDVGTIAIETTNDENLLKSLVGLERQTLNQIPEEYKPYTTNLSTRFGVVFYKDKIIVPRNLGSTIIILLHKGQ